jgi:hypothetical protein
MTRVTGIGGIFFKSDDPEKLCQWYEKHLGFSRHEDGGVEVDPSRENCGFGRFAWIREPEGNRIELWEPPEKRKT